MTEPRQNDPFEFMRQNAQMEQMMAGFAQLAAAAGKFHVELVTANVPPELAFAMVMEWWSQLLKSGHPK